MSHDTPYAVVIIPAHNEAASIEACLESVLNDPHRDQLDIVVVANGCTDDTVARARLFGAPVRVIDLSSPGKSAALDHALRNTAGVTRIYVDADVVVSPGAMTQIIETMDATGAWAAAPRIVFDASLSCWPVRQYLRVWAQSDYFGEGHVGTGLYAISPAGHRQVTGFAGLIADDLMPLRFPCHRRATAAGATFTPLMPTTVRSLIDISVRHINGAIDFDEWLTKRGERPVLTSYSRDWLKRLAHNPRNWPAIVIYYAIRLAIRLKASRRRHQDATTWLRDTASRQRVAQRRLLNGTTA